MTPGPASISDPQSAHAGNATLVPVPVRRTLRLVRPETPNQLHAYIKTVLGFRMPRRALIEGHDAPFDYVQHAFFEDRLPRDCVVWANRGGGKTQLGAIVTLLDMLFKPGIQVRILGGSLDQSSKMYGYLKHLLEDDVFRDLVAGRITGRMVSLVNGSAVEVLSQSERAVRGHRVHKLRCDEVELFEPEVWDAAQMVTRSGMCDDVFVRASIETMSTMHRPFGLMQRLVRDAASSGRCVFRWSVIDTLRRCEPSRRCEDCPLAEYCGGLARRAAGFIDIDDAIQQRARIGDATWKAEMLCERPSRSDTVYPEFDRSVHVAEFDAPIAAREGKADGMWIAGMDFGYRSPTVLFWAWHDEDEDVVHIIDELVEAERTTEELIDAAGERPWPRPVWIGADPAGHQRSEQTGLSTIALWKRADWPVRSRSIALEAGIRAVRRRLKRGDGAVGLRIHPRCSALIESLSMYHYPPDKPECTVPVKDGHDHAADALRYLIINLDRGDWSVTVREY